MKQRNFFFILPLTAIVCLGVLFAVYAAAEQATTPIEPNTVIDELKPLQPFLGKTWKGTLKSNSPDHPMIDISRWERALNGQAVRNLHSVNNGEYGGETIIMWDAQKQSLVYYYFTTAGFYTQGTMSFEGNKIMSHEKVTGNKNGITEVKATVEKLPDGRLRSKSYYLQNGQWVEGHEAMYVEVTAAEVIFK